MSRLLSRVGVRALAVGLLVLGLVPLVGINSGYCFAGNAALLGCCDVIIATKKQERQSSQSREEDQDGQQARERHQRTIPIDVGRR